MVKSNEFDIALIDLVRDQPGLWNSNMAENKSNEKKAEIWNSIASNIGAPVEVVKSRYHNMRTAYRKSVLLILKWHSTPSSERKGNPPRPYIYHAELEFLQEFFQLENIKECPCDLTNSDEDSTLDDTSDVTETKVNDKPTTSGITRKRSSTTADSDSDQPKKKPTRNLIDAVTQNIAGSGSIAVKFCSKHEDDDDDDFLFVQRLFLKLQKMPDDLDKERLKLKLETEVLKAMELRASQKTKSPSPVSPSNH